MLGSMNVRDELTAARYPLDRLSADSGVDYGYLKQLSAGNQGAGEVTLKALARGFVAQAARLLDLAARLLAAAEDGRAREARELAGVVRDRLGNDASDMGGQQEVE